MKPNIKKEENELFPKSDELIGEETPQVKEKQNNKSKKTNVKEKDITFASKPKLNDLKCQLCSVEKSNIFGIWQHYCCHLEIRKEITKSFTSESNKCDICGKVLENINLKVIHVGIKHGKTNDILKAKGLNPLQNISQKKIESMKTLYSEIPRHCRWFYPEGEAYQDDPHPVRNRGMGGDLQYMQFFL